MGNTHIFSKKLVAPAALLLTTAGLGCASAPPPSCTQIGCSDGLAVAFVPSSGWKPGHYKFEVNVDNELTLCEGNLPHASCDVPSLTCSPTSGRVAIIESGCSLPPAQHGFSGMAVAGPPAKFVSIRATLDGAGLVDTQFVPAYQSVQPNGPSCPPVCMQAVEKVVFSTESK
jgi:hypothetical protein